jgi:cytochrome oxidase Cu insertion factor (SCO1/SenC/PrrC family)
MPQYVGSQAKPIHNSAFSIHPLRKSNTLSFSVDIQLLDLKLVNQDGEPMRFKSDAIGEKLVVMDFIYTTCTTICPVYSALFVKLQNLLGERLGKDVAQVSLSVDPTTDIPSRLKEYAGRYQAKPGWTFLTGKKRDMEHVFPWSWSGTVARGSGSVFTGSPRRRS